jgi:CPA1 family monovalent cation:H+ antiporter
MMTDTQQFPLRNLIIFITFVVIFVTLVVQGLTLPLIVKFLKFSNLDDELPAQQQQAGIRLRLNTAALTYLEEKYPFEIADNEFVGFYKEELQNEIVTTRQKLDSMECDDFERIEIEQYAHILHDIYRLQRNELFKLRKEKYYSDEEIRRMEMQLDLDEMKITRHQH